MGQSNQDIVTKIDGAKKSNNFPAILEKFKGEIAKALPKHLNPDRMARIALTCFRRNPKLAQCDPLSVFAAVIQASQLGLEPDMLGRSYIIPYGKECQFIPGWKGLVDLANNSGQCNVWTGAVFDGDSFDYGLGDRPFVSQKPGDEDNPEALTHVYAIGRIKGSEWPNIEVWPIAKVWKHRDRYNKVGTRHYSFKHPEMYARKVVLLQILKYMPSSAELTRAIALNDAAELGDQHLSINDAIQGTWEPVADEPPGAAEDSAAESERATQAARPMKEKIVPSGGGNTPELKVSYSVIAERLNKARSIDELSVSADLIADIPNEQQRAELIALYEQRRIDMEDVPQ